MNRNIAKKQWRSDSKLRNVRFYICSFGIILILHFSYDKQILRNSSILELNFGLHSCQIFLKFYGVTEFWGSFFSCAWWWRCSIILPYNFNLKDYSYRIRGLHFIILFHRRTRIFSPMSLFRVTISLLIENWQTQNAVCLFVILLDNRISADGSYKGSERVIMH